MNVDLNHEMLKDEADGSCCDIWKFVLEYKMMIMHACEIAKCDYAKQMMNVVMQVIIC